MLKICNCKSNMMKSLLIFVVFFIYKVNTVLNNKNVDTEQLYDCIANIQTDFSESESTKNLIELIEQSSVILKAFCSEKLTSFIDYSDVDDPSKQDDDDNSKSKNNIDVEYYDNDNENYNYNYEYSNKDNNDNGKKKILLTFSPETIFKGTNILRKLELFNNQEYFIIKGDLNATVELNKELKAAYKRDCYDNNEINKSNVEFNENLLVEQYLRNFLPGQLIIFATFVNNKLVVKANSIRKWDVNIEQFLWNQLGWSKWHEWGHCTAHCNKGIQQRHRYCTKTQKFMSSDVDKTEKSETNKRWGKTKPKHNGEMKAVQSGIMHDGKATDNKQYDIHLCDGYNIEQRDCNLFRCKDAVDILPADNNQTLLAYNDLAAHISQIVDRRNFTIMFRIRSKLSKEQFFKQNDMKSHAHLFTLRSKWDKQTSFSINLIEDGLIIQQEKMSVSEMFVLELNLFNLQWHQIALSIQTNGMIVCFRDCIWSNTFVLSNESFELPKNPIIEFNAKLKGSIEWTQLTLITGNRERQQCSVERIPILDNNPFLLQQMFSNNDMD